MAACRVPSWRMTVQVASSGGGVADQVRRRSESHRDRSRARHGAHILLLLPALLLLVGLLAAPAVYIAWLSFHESTLGQLPVFVGLANYAALFADSRFWRAAWNTFAVVNVIVYGELALGLAVAVLVRKLEIGRKLVIAAIIAPYAITESSGIVMWRFMMEPDVGLVARMLGHVGLVLPWDFEPWAGLALSSLIAIWHHMPFTFLILYAALLSVPKETQEAAEIDGASAWQRFWLVEVPIIMPAILVAILFRYIFAIRLFGEVWLLTRGGPARLTEVLAIYLYRETFQFRNFGAASAAGVCMLLLSLLIALPYLYRMAKEVRRDA
jgi:multiple sugar transport system permease protein